MTYVGTKLPMMAVQNSQTADDGRSKQYNLIYTIFVLLWNYFEKQKNKIVWIVQFFDFLAYIEEARVYKIIASKL